MLLKWLPAEKIVHLNTACGVPDTGDRMEDFGFAGDMVSPEELVAAMDNFGLYSSDVMRELNGDFEHYVKRMEEAAQVLDDLTDMLKTEVREARWDDFSRDILHLSGLLHGIGARDCAGRARKLALAARDRNVPYIHDDFFSLMGNMYMLDKKLVALVPLARNGNLLEIPMNVPQALHGSLEKLGRALKSADAVEAMVQLANTAAISLDMDLDMALKAIKLDLEQGDFNAAIAKHDELFKNDTERLAVFENAVV